MAQQRSEKVGKFGSLSGKRPHSPAKVEEKVKLCGLGCRKGTLHVSRHTTFGYGRFCL